MDIYIIVNINNIVSIVLQYKIGNTSIKISFIRCVYVYH